MVSKGNGGLQNASIQMAELTYGYCKTHCKPGLLGTCCNEYYCEIAYAYAQKKGVTLQKTVNKIPFLDDTGKCICPPEFRVICTVHQCDINDLGFFKDDPDGKLTKKYFKLRDRIDKQVEIEDIEFLVES